MNPSQQIGEFEELVRSCEGTSHNLLYIKKDRRWRITMTQHYEKRPSFGPQKQVSFSAPSMVDCLFLASAFIKENRRELGSKFTTIKQ